MPTFSVTQRFWNDYDALTRQQQERFRRARDTFVRLLLAWEAEGCRGNPTFPKRLGVKSMVVSGKRYMEPAWDDDGRCVWEYGAPRLPGKCHITWRRIGTHAIYEDP